MAIEWINEIDIDKIPKPSEGIDEETKAKVDEVENMSFSSMMALAELFETLEQKDLENKMALAEVFELIEGGLA